MAHQWRGVIAEYADRLPEHLTRTVVTLGEGGTPLVPARALSERTGADVHLKVEGMNPTGSFKDRGMTTAISAAAARGAKVVVCASTGNTSASAAAYATAAGMLCAVLVPDGKIAMGKLSQAIAHGARLLQVDGNFDDCLVAARKLADAYGVELVNSVNPDRIQGQKTGAFEVVDALGDAPDIHVLPVGNAGNITAYWKGYTEYAADGPATRTPAMWGFQAAGAAPIVAGHPVTHPETIATAIRIGNPASWEQATAARDTSGGLIESVTDDQILAAHRVLSSECGVFVEPASAAGVAGILMLAEQGRVPAGARIVVTVTGHGLKDPQWALRTADGDEIVPVRVGADVVSIADALELSLTVVARTPGAVTPLGADHVRVRVPATSANLGPGFDALGLALGVHDEVEVRRLGEPGTVVEVTGEGAGEVPDGEAHLVVRALRLALDHVGAPQPGLHLVCTNRIPHGRGMGSSAGAVVAGLLAARGLLADPTLLDDDVVLRLATDIEGHPDNAAPAVRGGATVAWCEPSGARAVRVPTHADLAPVVLIPEIRLATSTARGLLPATVPHGDAAFAAGRAALLVHALGERPDLLLAATEDRLHQAYRTPAMPDSLDLVGALRARGVAAVVSGAGPTVLVLARAAGDGATDADDAVRDVLSGTTSRWHTLVPGLDRDGATVERVLRRGAAPDG